MRPCLWKIVHISSPWIPISCQCYDARLALLSTFDTISDLSHAHPRFEQPWFDSECCLSNLWTKNTPEEQREWEWMYDKQPCFQTGKINMDVMKIRSAHYVYLDVELSQIPWNSQVSTRETPNRYFAQLRFDSECLSKFRQERLCSVLKVKILRVQYLQIDFLTAHLIQRLLLLQDPVGSAFQPIQPLSSHIFSRWSMFKAYHTDILNWVV